MQEQGWGTFINIASPPTAAPPFEMLPRGKMTEEYVECCLNVTTRADKNDDSSGSAIAPGFTFNAIFPMHLIAASFASKSTQEGERSGRRCCAICA
jgi:hypothetical protein